METNFRVVNDMLRMQHTIRLSVNTLYQQVAAMTFGLCALTAVFLFSVQTASADVIHSKSAKFRIPFQFDAAELKRLGASEIQLYVTTDQGETWNLVQSVSPDQTKFTFEAVTDGEHWFSVRTLNKSGLSYPPGPHLPSLQVIVDTTKPVLDLEVEEIEPGRVRLSWSAEDNQLDEKSLVLEYLDPGANNWETVSVSHLITGQTSWTVAEAGALSVRGSVQDVAGNITNSSAEVAMSALPSKAGETPDFSRPVADMKLPGSKTPEVLETASANQPVSVNNSQLSNIRESFSKSASTPEAAEALKTIITPAVKDSNISNVESEQMTIQEAPVANKTPEAQPEVVANEKLETEEVTPQLQSTPLTPTSTTPQLPQPKILANHKLSQPPGMHLVNSQTFRVAYELDNVGPSGVSSVELYITEDKGLRWFHYGSDPDRMSPFEVQVPRDGEYGFAFRVRNGVGVIATPPQPGNAPEVKVTVDRTPPVAQLFPIREGEGKNQVVIEWTARDRELDAHPIALYYAHQQNGPWELIKGWTTNSGRLVWDVPSTFNKQLFVRLEVRDSAGNSQRIDTERPFMLDQSKPKARVTDVESLRDNAQ